MVPTGLMVPKGPQGPPVQRENLYEQAALAAQKLPVVVAVEQHQEQEGVDQAAYSKWALALLAQVEHAELVEQEGLE